MLTRLFSPVRAAASALPGAAEQTHREPLGSKPVEGTHIAVIAGRHCLAYQGSVCSLCHEHCPIQGALVLEQGLPKVEPALCTGCGICHDVCPAPENAVRVVPRPPGLPPLRKTDSKPPSPFPDLPDESGAAGF